METEDLNKISLQLLFTAKLVGMGSDGASNMVGKKGGLSALLKNNINDELVNVHCFAHRLELAFRNVLKKRKLYDRLYDITDRSVLFLPALPKAKAGLGVQSLRPSVHPSVPKSCPRNSSETTDPIIMKLGM